MSLFVMFRSSILFCFTILTNNLTTNSTWQYCCVDFLFQLFDKMVNNRDFLKTTNLRNTWNSILERTLLKGSDGHCVYDWLQIHDGRDASARVIGRYCGTAMPPNFITTTNKIYMWMRTDHSVSRAGKRVFKIVTKAVLLSFLPLLNSLIQVNNYEIVVKFFQISHKLTWYSAIFHCS